MPPFLIPVLFLLPVVLVLGMGPFVSRFSGWARLAEYYKAGLPFEGSKLILGARMNSANYGFSLMGANIQGFSLEAALMIRSGHPALFFPWSEMTAKEAPGIFYPRVFVEFKKVPGVVLAVYKKDILKLKEAAGVAQAFPEITA